MTETKLTEASLNLFLWYAKDANNWSGLPYLSGNRTFTKSDRGNLTQLKRAGLVTTNKDDHAEYIKFTGEGYALALKHGITIERF